jgi:hypothetical protein
MTSQDPAADDDGSLLAEYRALVAEHKALSERPADSEAFREHSVKLRVHIDRLKARIAALREKQT